MIKSRSASLAVIIFVYVLAAFGGIVSYTFFHKNFSIEQSLLFADIFATAIVFAFSLIFDNASVYDPYWSVQPPVILGAFVIGNKFSETNNNGFLGFLFGKRLREALP